MKNHALEPSKESLPNVTPLIDVVMCLIIFFMLVACAETQVNHVLFATREVP